MRKLEDWCLLVTPLVILLLHSVSSRNYDSRLAIDGSRPVKTVTEAPYVVALMEKTYVLPFCTGSIIDPEWVLTAAHCVKGLEGEHRILVIAGTERMWQFGGSLAQKRFVKEMHIHPKYWAGTQSKYDVAIVGVNKFNFSERVGKVNLWATEWVKPAPGDLKKEWSMQKCNAFGWGTIDDGIPSFALRTSTLPIRHGTYGCPCLRRFQQRRLVCSVHKSRGGTCPGDSGGPLICNGSQAGVGHVFYNRNACRLFGSSGATCNGLDTISAWMYVCPMLNFISEHVKSVPNEPESCMSSRLISMSLLQLAMLSIIITMKPS